MSVFRSVMRYILYPTLMVGALALLWALLAGGAGLAWAPYVVVAVIGPLVVMAERLLPYRARVAAQAARLW